MSRILARTLFKQFLMKHCLNPSRNSTSQLLKNVNKSYRCLYRLISQNDLPIKPSRHNSTTNFSTKLDSLSLFESDGASSIEDGPIRVDSSRTHESKKFFRFDENDYIYHLLHKDVISKGASRIFLDGLAIKTNLDEIERLSEAQNVLSIIEVKSQLRDNLQAIKNGIKDLTLVDLAKLLAAIADSNGSEYDQIRLLIDAELSKALKSHMSTNSIDLDLWFYVADLFYYARFPRSNFVRILREYSLENYAGLNDQGLMHLLFLMILNRNQDDMLPKFEKRFCSILHQGDVNLATIIALSYFKTRTQIRNRQVLNLLLNALEKNLHMIDPKSIVYCSIVKTLRYSTNWDNRSSIDRLIKKLATPAYRHILSASSFNTIQTMKLMESFKLYNSEVLDCTVDSLLKNIDVYRVKDLQYAITSLSNLAYKDLQVTENLKIVFERLCESIVFESRSDKVLQNRHIMPLIRAFTVFGYYDESLLDYTSKRFLDPNRRAELEDVFEFDRSALLVHVATQLEYPQVKLNTDMFRRCLDKIDQSSFCGQVKAKSFRELDNVRNVDPKSMGRKYLMIANSLARNEYLEDSAYNLEFQFTMPHQNYADLVISKGARAPGNYDAKTLLPASIEPGARHCMLLLIKKTDIISGNRITGFKRLIRRLLTKVGYHVILVNADSPGVDDLAYRIQFYLETGKISPDKMHTMS